MEAYVFWPVAVLALASAIAMVLSRNPVHSALFLVGNFFGLAVLFLLLDAFFLAAVQVIVYAGAIMVLFLFVIMLLGISREEVMTDPVRYLRPLAVAFGVALIALIVFTIRTTFGTATFAGLDEANAAGNVQAVGRGLFQRYLFPFEVTSLLLIVAAIGAVLLGRARDPEEDEEITAQADRMAAEAREGAEPERSIVDRAGTDHPAPHEPVAGIDYVEEERL